MFEIIKPDVNFQIVAKQRFFLIVSAIGVLLSLAAIIFMGPTYGIDFKGGSDIILRFTEDVEAQAVRDAADRAGLPDAQVQRYGTKEQKTFLVQTRAASVMDETKADEIRENLAKIGTVTEFTWAPNQPNRARVTFDAPVSTDEIKKTVEKSDLQGIEVAESNTSGQNRYDISFEDLQTFVTDAFAEEFPTQFDPAHGIARMETVGSTVGAQFRNAGILSLLVALLAIMLYIAIRFDIRYAPGAVVSLLHDIIIVVGIFTIIQHEISLPTIAALLTILGYSINDTIIVYDRIRENLASADDDASVPEVANRSINETLSRTIMTSTTTLLAISAIAVLGSGIIQDFALALIIGIAVGTYSSIFVASSVMVRLDAFITSRREAQELIDAQAADAAPSA
ncbi:protein translocase subunit SecF [Bradymonas sediminis]|uniref:Protein-export membrane protein SecF n=1 Tax=Bradymonas sediminis TaxID=1548548 RepID=A0A2Z4FKQ6_9DELT|nr:protein translocase subunit SecF [Bradymonas sediminis]AWV89549.1 protein translocase subunit SecF [Bradymonas sediminis]TDP76718.1 protein translocase subunit secF [Bradymonas sediminis]